MKSLLVYGALFLCIGLSLGCPQSEDHTVKLPIDETNHLELGDGKVASSVFQSDSDWRYDFGGMSQQQVMDLFVVDLKSNAALRLRNYLATLTPKSLVQRRSDVWMRFWSDANGSSLFIDCSHCSPIVKSFFCDDVVALEFLTHFSGLRCESPNSAGAFLGSDLVFLKSMMHGNNLPDENSWTNSVVFYHATNGDLLLVDSGGGVAWHIFSENRVVEYSCSLADAIEIFVRCLEAGEVYDSYSFEDLHEGKP